MMRVPGVLPRGSNLNPRYSFGNEHSQISHHSCLFECRKSLPNTAARTQQERNSTHPPHDHSSLAPCCFQSLALAFGCTSVCS